VLDVVAIQEKLKERIDDVEALVIQSEARDVIFRTELLKRLGQIEARITGLERAEMEQRNAEDKLRPKARQEEFSRVMTGVRELVKGLPEDVEIIKKCLPEIEKRIGLRRKQVEAEQ
jgi:predicted secreted protein